MRVELLAEPTEWEEWRRGVLIMWGSSTMHKRREEFSIFWKKLFMCCQEHVDAHILSIFRDLQGVLQNTNHTLKFINNLCERMLQKSIRCLLCAWPWSPLAHTRSSLSRLVATSSVAGKILAIFCLFFVFAFQPQPIRVTMRVVGVSVRMRSWRTQKERPWCALLHLCCILGGGRKWRDLDSQGRAQNDGWQGWEEAGHARLVLWGLSSCKSSLIEVYVCLSVFAIIPWALLGKNHVVGQTMVQYQPFQMVPMAHDGLLELDTEWVPPTHRYPSPAVWPWPSLVILIRLAFHLNWGKAYPSSLGHWE